MEDGKVVIKTDLDTKSFEEQIRQTENKLNRLEKAYQKAMNPPKGMQVNKEAIQKLRLEIEKTSNKLISLKDKQDSLSKSSLIEMPNIMGNIGRSVDGITRKIVRWGLAVFGVRSAYNAIRSAMDTIASQDEQLAADIEYMKNALAYTLEPVVRGIVNLMKQLMFYVGYIVKAWTGKDIFANANKSLKGATGSAKALNKELNKTTASFDEMNVLNDTSSGGGGAGGGGALPSFDLTQGFQGEVPAWLEWIANNKDIVIAALFGIAAGITAIKLGASGLMALGIGIAVAGIVLLVEDIIKFIKDPSWDNFANILRDLAIILAGVAIAMLAVNAANPIAWILVAIAVVAALAAAVIKNWDTIKETLGKVGAWINDHIIKPVGEFFSGLWKGIVDGVKDGIKKIKDFFNGLPDFFKGLIKKINSLLEKIGTAVGEVISGAFKGVVNGILWAIENILNTPIKAVNKLINVINKVPGINLGKLSTFNLPRLAKGGIINQPSRGVPVGSAIGGESGAEGVIPLTDSQQMALLGEAIGRYITVNANITNTMNGRVISRELQKIQNENDFAFNK